MKCTINIDKVMARTMIKLTCILYYRIGSFDHEIKTPRQMLQNGSISWGAASHGVQHLPLALWGINTPNHWHLGTANQFQQLLKSVAHQVQKLHWPIPEDFRSLNSTVIAFSWWQSPAFLPRQVLSILTQTRSSLRQ